MFGLVFFIGKPLSFIKNLISNRDITVIITEQLLKEIVEVTSKEKLKKYFPKKVLATYSNC